MTLNRLLSASLALSMLAAPAFSQGYNRGGYEGGRPNPFNGQDSVAQPNQTYRGEQGFSFQGDELSQSHDRRYLGQSDPRYSQTYDQQRQQAQAQPGGGCLKYGAVGAAGGHLAGHGVLGALAGCVTGALVRSRDKAAIRAQHNGQY